jgi:hypothetical protein
MLMLQESVLADVKEYEAPNTNVCADDGEMVMVLELFSVLDTLTT